MDKVKVLSIDTAPAQKSIKELRKELNEYKNQMANLDADSDAFKSVALQAGEVKHQIDEINESVKGASSDIGDMIGNATNVAAGLVGAFQAVQGGLQAMGVESEAVNETIAKMQGLMAMTQGLAAIDDGIKSFGKLTKAIGLTNTSLKGTKKALIYISWNQRETTMPEDLCYLYGQFFDDYLHDVEICQRFARRNREKIGEVLLARTGMTGGEAFHTIHNYIDTDEMILRKGAIAAHAGEKVLIPINMRDGSVLAIGKGNPEWNYSAPHGAGRIMSRTKAKNELDMEAYRKSMEGIYTTSVNEKTLDEAPMAYKSLEDIIDVIEESVDIIEIMKPIYNFKAN